MDGNIGIARASCSQEVSLSDEELAAVEGWRRANRIGSCDEALRQLVRLGLLSEIGRIYQAVCRQGDGATSERP